ncbi:hypothetical protein [Halorussus sp. AFM4]|uniref:hypothetical protein n=1 Tax=Halorussus sp. AFM4 TaxID=3421651 RepID=UPI003EBCE24C
MSRQTRPKFAATCRACAEECATDDPNEIVEFYRRHHSLTGHDVEWERADLPVLERVPLDADLQSVVEALDEHYENGVPLGVVTAAASRRGATVGETLEEVREVRLTGRFWEPSDDRISAY